MGEDMKDMVRLSESEWKIIRLFDDRTELSTTEIVDTLEQTMSWKHRTTTTMLSRLVKKGALSYEVQGRSYVYSMRISSMDCIQAENESFLNKVYDGTLKNLFASFIEQKELTIGEIEELKNLLEKKRKEKDTTQL